ncbi:MAG TPA: hypothetical protein VMD92_13045 [Acidobacteriaceae bacterium]|jgi:hypothetical protein|nr:hypothetical protein [Acidobacteriaceae bacterium]
MSVSRRQFAGSAAAIGLLSAFLPPESVAAFAQTAQQPASPDDAPHDPFEFWSGFYDAVNPASKSYGTRGRGPTESLPDPDLQTQYLHYVDTEKRLRYATDIKDDSLLDHDGDVAVSIMLSQFRPGTGDQKVQASQLRVDATQTSPLLNLFAPLAWTAIASLNPNGAGKIPPLDELGFKSDQAIGATSHILLTKGYGKLAVNISRAPNDSTFLKMLKVMITGAKLVAPLVTLPAVSVPALSTFSEAFAYFEDRTRFIMNGNLVNAVATKQALADPQRQASYIGLVSGDYVMVPKKHTDELGTQLPNLVLDQGYLVVKDASTDVPVESRAQSTLPGITYATMRVAVSPVTIPLGAAKADSGGSSGSEKKKKEEPKHEN